MTLVAIGAGPRSRRPVAGASAALVGALSAIFAVGVGLVPPMLLLHLENRNYLFVVPWRVIAAVVNWFSVSSEPNCIPLMRR